MSEKMPNKEMVLKNIELGIVPHAVFLNENLAITRGWGSDEGKPSGNYYPGFWDESVGGFAFVTNKEQAEKFKADLAQPALHPDDIAVDKFAAAMKEKLAKKRTHGEGDL